MKNTVFPHKFWRPFLDCMPQLFFRPQYVWFPVHLKGHLIPLCYETLVVNWQNWLFTLFHQSRSVLSPNPIHNQSLTSQEKTDINIGLNKTRHDTSHHGNVFRITDPLWGNPLVNSGSSQQQTSNAKNTRQPNFFTNTLCLTHWSRDKLPEFEMHFVERNHHVESKNGSATNRRHYRKQNGLINRPNPVFMHR